MNAVTMLEGEHRQVEALFQQYSSERDLLVRRRVAERIMAELRLHADEEEQHFYPAARQATPGAGKMVADSYEDHAKVRHAIARLEGMRPEDPAYHPAMEQLELMVERHVEEEEGELFPKVAEAIGAMRLEQIGAEMEETRRASLPRG